MGRKIQTRLYLKSFKSSGYFYNLPIYIYITLSIEDELNLSVKFEGKY